MHPALIGRAGSQLPGNHTAVYGGLADRQLLMKPGWRVERVRCGKWLSDLLSYAPHVLGSYYMQVHDCTVCTHSFTSSCGDQSQVLECNHVSDSPPPHLLRHHHPPHHPVTNIYTAKEGTACVITTSAEGFSKRSVSFPLLPHRFSEVSRCRWHSRTHDSHRAALITRHESCSGHTCRPCK